MRNADRKALKEQARSGRGYQYDNYQPSRVYVRRDDDWRDNVLRSVVANVVTFNNVRSYTPYYGDQYSSGSYYSPGYSNSYYQPYQTYSSGYYPAYQYPVDTYTSYYNFYTPYQDTSYGYTDPYYYGGNDVSPYAYADDLGLPLLSQSSFGGIVSQLFSQLIAYGYNEGYRDAQYARTQGQRTRYYDDPYDPYVMVDDDVDLSDVGYNPYSCIAEDRRYVSQGYELGYRDALYGSNDYDPYSNGSTLDLVSALITASL